MSRDGRIKSRYRRPRREGLFLESFLSLKGIYCEISWDAGERAEPTNVCSSKGKTDDLASRH